MSKNMRVKQKSDGARRTPGRGTHDEKGASADGQKQAEFVDRRKFLQAIIDTGPECIKIITADGTLVMMNPAGLEMIQADSAEQVKGKSVLSLVAPEYLDDFKKLIEKIFQGKTGRLTFQMTGLKGRVLWVDTHAAPLRNEKGEVVAMLGLTHDVTERTKAEEVLKKERDFSAAVLETVGAMILILDREGRIVRFNRTCEEVSGYAGVEVLGKHVWDFLIPPEQVEDVQKVFKSLASGTFPNRYENYWVTRDGQRKMIAWSNTALLAPDGSVEHVIATGIDINERMLAETALMQEKKFIDAVIDSLPGLFYVIDESGSLIRWNKNLQEVTGFSTDELTNRNALDFFREDRELVRGKIQEVLKFGSASDEARMVTKSGISLSFMLTGIKMIMNDRPYLVGTGIDISERKRLEDQLRQAQKLESVGTLAGGIAHDFNNILTAIIGYGSLLQMKMKNDDPLLHSVEQILVSANRAAGLTQGLLAYSRKQVMNPQLINLNEVILKLERLFARLIGEDVEFKCILTDQELTAVADSGQIEQVLMNLATNARDAMPDGGYLYIETRLVELDEDSARVHDLRKAGSYALITVMDSGTGMDQKTLDRIFEPFFTTKEVGKGTGLGLAMVYGIIKQHKGSIEVDTELGKGTTFRIYLPFTRRTTEEIQPIVPQPLMGGTETVLVAEDDASVRILTANILEQFGYTVIQASDGEDAVKKFMANKDRIRLLLLDVVMPRKNGKEVFDKVRIFKPDVRALFMSGYAEDVLHQKGLLDIAQGVIVKPVKIDELLKKMRKVLDEK